MTSTHPIMRTLLMHRFSRGKPNLKNHYCSPMIRRASPQQCEHDLTRLLPRNAASTKD
jgi:hypothetical protein